jgi:hypothetical protein
MAKRFTAFDSSNLMLLKLPAFASRYHLQNHSGKGSSVLELFLRILVIIVTSRLFSLYANHQKPTMKAWRSSYKPPTAEVHSPLFDCTAKA